MKKIPCLSIRQPWAWAIFHLGKDIENRSWKPPQLDRIYVHAAKTYDRDGAIWISKTFGVTTPHKNNLPMGQIIGHIDINGYTQESDSPWAIAGQIHWQISNPVLISPVEAKGRLGLFYWDIECLNANHCNKDFSPVNAENPTKKCFIANSPHQLKLF